MLVDARSLVRTLKLRQMVDAFQAIVTANRYFVSSNRSTYPSVFAKTTTPESIAALYSIPVLDDGAFTRSEQPASACLNQQRARELSSFPGTGSLTSQRKLPFSATRP